MARFNKIQVVQKIYDQGMMPLFYHPDIEVGKKVLDAVYNGGGRILEFTNRGDFAHEVFGALVKYAASELPEMIIGSGSIHDAGTASLYIQLGSNFIVSHAINPDVAKVCNRRKIMWSPGCGTTTEIAYAEELGAEIVKIFPGSTLGPGFVKAVLGPSPWSSIMPTGGVSPTEENLRGWFGAGVSCVGMGSQLISRDVLRDGAYDVLEQRVAATLKLIEQIRANG